MMKNTTIILLHFGLPQFFSLCLKNGISSDKNVYESTGRSKSFSDRVDRESLCTALYDVQSVAIVEDR